MNDALLYNPRPEQPDLALPDDIFEEYDGPGTIVAVHLVESDRHMPRRLEKGGYPFAFNIADAPSVCELLDLPYTGSDHKLVEWA